MCSTRGGIASNPTHSCRTLICYNAAIPVRGTSLAGMLHCGNFRFSTVLVLSTNRGLQSDGVPDVGVSGKHVASATGNVISH